jgi:hypothetical protein
MARYTILTRRSPRHTWVLRAEVAVPPNDLWVQVGRFSAAHDTLGDVRSEVVAIRGHIEGRDPATGFRGDIPAASEERVVIRVSGRDITKGRGVDLPVD